MYKHYLGLQPTQRAEIMESKAEKTDPGYQISGMEPFRKLPQDKIPKKDARSLKGSMSGEKYKLVSTEWPLRESSPLQSRNILESLYGILPECQCSMVYL
ncbi:hypothetical protein M514_01828 [Trichuris suis]|uniref:Uncharacterized protein n=1 Tax=Trichuris suis TaxID=68888 RepID=A0A085NTA7_9BILA|nr:hypothetical protein M513_01828 [Trichuris suis]KFD72703.1 hypothetical protein M514_01828 [Trichuris suis]